MMHKLKHNRPKINFITEKTFNFKISRRGAFAQSF